MDIKLDTSTTYETYKNADKIIVLSLIDLLKDDEKDGDLDVN